MVVAQGLEEENEFSGYSFNFAKWESSGDYLNATQLYSRMVKTVKYICYAYATTPFLESNNKIDKQ